MILVLSVCNEAEMADSTTKDTFDIYTRHAVQDLCQSTLRLKMQEQLLARKGILTICADYAGSEEGGRKQ